MKKILFITTNLDFGGSERRCTTLSLELCKKGYAVTVLCLMHNSQDYFIQLLRDADVEIVTAPQQNIWATAFHVRKLIKSNGYDTVVSILYLPNFVNCIAAIGRHSWNVVVGEPSAYKQAQKGHGWFFRMKTRLMFCLYRFSDYIVSNSYNAKKSIEYDYPQYKNKIKVIYNPVNLAEIKSIYTPRIDGRLHICVAASIKRVKNPCNVAKALALLDNDERKQIVVEWYGNSQSDSTYESLMEFVEDNHLQECMILKPATKDIADKMNQADCVGLFSVSEGLPNAICEALVIGKPVIMSKCSDFNNLVRGNGFLCEWDDPTSIKDVMVSIISKSNEEIENMGRESRKIASELLARNKIINQWINIIEKRL